MLTRGVWSRLGLENGKMEPLIADAKELVLTGREASTRRKYLSYFKTFLKWADDNLTGVKFPVSGDVFGLFLTDVSRRVNTLSTFYAHVYGVKYAHDICGYDNPALHPFPKLIIEGAKRKLSKPSESKNAISPAIMNEICRSFGKINTSIKDLRFATMALLAYAGFLRFSELSHIRRENLKFHDGYFSLFIPRSKTDVYNKGNEILISETGNASCPMRFLLRYLTSIEMRHDGTRGFIFRNLNPSDNSSLTANVDLPISYTRAREELLSYLGKICQSPKQYGWHSFRHGGATQAANAKVPDRLLKKHGRWASDSAKNGYVHEDLVSRLSVTSGLGI